MGDKEFLFRNAVARLLQAHGLHDIYWMAEKGKLSVCLEKARQRTRNSDTMALSFAFGDLAKLAKEMGF